MSISFLCHFSIPCSFQYFSIIRTSFHHSSVIPSIIVHVDNILSFQCHSIHSMVIWAVEWRGMTFCRNDRNEGRMIIWVIRSAFSSFLSSQMSWKNVVILDFIPAIPVSFRHLGVIQKFLINVNDPEWWWNDRNFWAEVDHFPLRVFMDCLEYWKSSQIIAELQILSTSCFCDMGNDIAFPRRCLL